MLRIAIIIGCTGPVRIGADAIQEKHLTSLLDHVIAWSDALGTLKDKRGY